MKELSIEEKAKAYDEAIEKAKVLYQAAEPMSGCNVIIETLFPKLKESEGEKIRKWLIGYFNQYIIDGMPQVFGNGLNVIDVITWLEKQGEQKLPIEKLPLEMKTLSESLGFTTQKECDDYNKMVIDLIMSDDDNGEQKELKKEKVDNLHNYLYGEQKPVEWSSEQSKTLQTDDVPNESSTAAPLRTGAIGFDGEPIESKPCEQNSAWSEEDELHIRELERLVKQVWAIAEHENDKETIHKMSDLSFFLKTLKPQLKQEWSEEDEETLKDIITSITNLKDSATSDALRYIYNSKIDWLKFLKERYTWKPSEEEMVALEHAINCYSSISPTNTNEVFILEIMKERLKNLIK